MIMLQKQKCGEDNITTLKTSTESHISWRKPFHKNLSFFRINAGFEVDNEEDNSNIGNKTTNIHKQIPVLYGYR